jgi:predicted  nucleic acid-binding Zn-ribbon protein
MPTLEERVAYLEGKVEEHSKAWEDLKDMIINLEGRINALDQKVDRRLDALDVKVERFREELSRRIDSLDHRIDSLDQKFSRYFLWIIGIQMSIFLAIIASFLRR